MGWFLENFSGRAAFSNLISKGAARWIIVFIVLMAVMVLFIGINQTQREHSLLIAYYSLPDKNSKKYKTKTVIIFKKNIIQIVEHGAYMTYAIEEYIEDDKTYVLKMIGSTFISKSRYPDLAYMAIRDKQIWYFTIGLKFQQKIIFYIDQRELIKRS